MKFKIIAGVVVVVLGLAALLKFYPPSQGPRPVVSEQQEKDRQTLGNSQATEVETYEALHRLAHEHDEGALDAALKKIADPSRVVREGAANALGYYSDDLAFEGLSSLLSDPEENVRLRTLQALANLKEGRRIRLVIDFLRRDDLSPREKTTAHSVLVKIDVSPEQRDNSVQFLVNMAKAGDELENYIAFSKLVELLPNESRVAEVARQKIESSPNSEMVSLGIRYLASAHDKWLAQRLGRLLKNQNENIRAAAELAEKQIAEAQ